MADNQDTQNIQHDVNADSEGKFEGTSRNRDFTEAISLAIEAAKNGLRADLINWRLVDVIGEDGGFILSSDLTVIIHAKSGPAEPTKYGLAGMASGVGIDRKLWEFSDRFARNINEVSFAGVPFGTIFESAMAMVDIAMRDGRLVREADKLIKQYPPYRFRSVDM